MLLQRHTRGRRRAAILPLVAVALIALFAMVALAIDIGLVTLARTQCQNAADIAAMAAVRQLNGDVSNNNNYAAVDPTARAAAAANMVLGKNVDPANVTIQVGYYAYDATQQRFSPNFSGSKPATENWSAVQVNVSANDSTYFAKVFGSNAFSADATATAVHRPRDIAIVLDYSSSMQYSCQTAYPPSGNYAGSLNPDPAFPKFGHWSTLSSVMQRTTMYVDSGGETHSANNMTIDTPNGPALVNDFLMRDSGNNLVNAFNRASTTYDPMTAATPAPADWDVQSDATVAYVGDKWPCLNKTFTGTYAKTVQEFLFGNNTTQPNTVAKSTATGPGGTQFDPVLPAAPLPTEGYGPNFKGYSMGPGYYGKTFYMWPPDPRYHATLPSLQLDWRKKFFYKKGTTTPVDDNSVLWDSVGNWLQAGQTGSYDINYTAIVQWLTSGPQVLPPNLRAGRVLYYSSIPTTIPATGGTPDQMFWRSYINYVIGAGSATSQQQTGYGRESSGWGTVRITPKASLTNANPPYMHPNDNPIRPRLQFWFGPLSMLAFIAPSNDGAYSRNWRPGSCHECHCWQLKAGIQSALSDIRKNHPNDWAALIYFSNIATYATPRVPMGRSYDTMRNALFFPFSLLNNLGDQNAEIRPYDSNFSSTVSGDVPNAAGTTTPAMAFMNAYSQFSSASGFNGRRGAAKVLIFETDGVPNTTASGTLNTGGGAYNSYYTNIAPGSFLGNNNATVTSGAISIIDQICASDTANPPGYSSAKLPARVHAIAFGDLFESGSTLETQALNFLLRVQQHGNTSPAGATSIENYKIIVGDYNTRINLLRQALEHIMQSGIQVALIK